MFEKIICMLLSFVFFELGLILGYTVAKNSSKNQNVFTAGEDIDKNDSIYRAEDGRIYKLISSHHKNLY